MMEKIVHVVAWQDRNGPGFDWYRDEEEANRAFEEIRARPPGPGSDDRTIFQFALGVPTPEEADVITKIIDDNLGDFCAKADRKAGPIRFPCNPDFNRIRAPWRYEMNGGETVVRTADSASREGRVIARLPFGPDDDIGDRQSLAIFIARAPELLAAARDVLDRMQKTPGFSETYPEMYSKLYDAVSSVPDLSFDTDEIAAGQEAMIDDPPLTNDLLTHHYDHLQHLVEGAGYCIKKEGGGWRAWPPGDDDSEFYFRLNDLLEEVAIETVIPEVMAHFDLSDEQWESLPEKAQVALVAAMHADSPSAAAEAGIVVG